MRKLLNPIEQYISEVKKNPNNYCKKIKQLIVKIEEILKDKNTFYDDEAVTKIFTYISFFKTYQDDATTEAGSSIKLLSWQKFFIACMYGVKRIDGESYTSYFTKAFLLVGKKNGKTTLITALALINLITVVGAEVIIVNANYKLAGKTFDTFKSFIMKNDMLREAVESGDMKISDYDHTILYYPMSSKVMTLTDGIKADTQGFNPSFLIFDEAALYSSGEIISKLQTGRNRPDAFSMIITTAETNTTNPAYYEYERSDKILNGQFDMFDYLPMIYELDVEDYDHWSDEKYWIKTNPSLGIVRMTSNVRSELNSAIQSGDPEEEPRCKAYFFNMWSASAKRGISSEDWNIIIMNGKDNKEYLDHLEDYSVTGGVDLSLVDDFTAYSLYFYIDELDKYYAKHRFYIPEKQIEKKMKRDSPHIRKWIQQEHITTCNGEDAGKTIDYSLIARDIENDIKRFPKLKLIGGDPVYLRHVRSNMKPENSELIINFEQSWAKMGFATSDWYKDILEGKILDDNPVMAWMVGCAKFSMDKNKNMHVEKVDYAQSTSRIDGLITSIMAHALLKENVIGGTVSISDDDLRAFYSMDIF